MKLRLTHFSLVATFTLLLATSCQKETITPEANELSANAERNISSKTAEDGLIKTVRNATAKFHSTTLAIKEGYMPDDFCVSAPDLGGMGYHWVNPSLVDPVFDPAQPEVMLYAKGPGGNLRLIAVEYIVINVGQPAPMFGEEEFEVGGTPVPVPHWSLHVWVHENNPSGMFAEFNPNITCP